ncbi:hypothetical protein ACFL19_00070 [Pseudomonadota bacterium]
MGIALLLGAGASFGSDVDMANTPELGRGIYNAIKDCQIGPRIHYKKDLLQLDNPADYDLPPNKEVQNTITIDEWVELISRSAHESFMSGDFEQGMLLLDEQVDKARKERISQGGLIRDYMSPSNEFGDISLTEKIMREITKYLYQFPPFDSNFFYAILAELPTNSCIFTLNYDVIIEEVALKSSINLIEPEGIDKALLSDPDKELLYYQLHGGVTLCTSWAQRRAGVAGLQMVSPAQRIQHTWRNGEGGYGFLLTEDYINRYCNNAILSYYNKEKYTANSPQIIKDIQRGYRQKLLSDITKLIVIGCRYVPHDKHVWKAVEEFSGEIYWCGSKEDMPPPSVNSNITYIGDTFAEALSEIMELIA